MGVETHYKKVTKNTLWLTIGTFGSKSISFFLLPIFTRVLTREIYGKIDFFSTTLNLSVLILSFGIGSAVFKFVTMEDKEDSEVLSTAFFSSIVSLCILLLAYPFLSLYQSFREIGAYFVILFYLNILNAIIRSYIRAKEKLHLFALSDILKTVSYGVFGIIFIAVLKQGLEGYFKALTISVVTGIFILILTSNTFKLISLKNISFSTYRDMMKFSIPLLPSSISWWIMNVSDRYLITYYLGFEALGVYSVSCRFYSLFTLIVSIFTQAWAITALKVFKTEDRDHFYTRVFSYMSTFYMLIILSFSIVMKPVVFVMVGERYHISWEYLPFLLLSVLFLSYANFYGVGYLASGETKRAVWVSVTGAVVNFGINVLFIPFIGIQAAALSTMLAYFTLWFIRIFQMKKYFTISVNWFLFTLKNTLVGVSLFLPFVENSISLLFQLLCFSLFLILSLKDIRRMFGFFSELAKNRLTSIMRR